MIPESWTYQESSKCMADAIRHKATKMRMLRNGGKELLERLADDIESGRLLTEYLGQCQK